jgi:hypothetical protein
MCEQKTGNFQKFQWAYPTDLIQPAAFPVRRWIPHSPKRACVRTYQYRTPELVFLEMAGQHGSSIGYSDVGVYCKKNLTSFRPTFDRTGKCRRASQQNTFLRTTHATWTHIGLKQHENLYEGTRSWNTSRGYAHAGVASWSLALHNGVCRRSCDALPIPAKIFLSYLRQQV